jgi:hypothetical protein
MLNSQLLIKITANLLLFLEVLQLCAVTAITKPDGSPEPLNIR